MTSKTRPRRTAHRSLICAALAVALASPIATSAETETSIGPITKLPLPRYVSLRSGEINVRRGPGLDYRKDWVFRRAGLPVQVVDEYGDWRRIVDQDSAGGWVYHALITGRRTALVTADRVTLLQDPDDAADPVAEAEQGVVARLIECTPAWCEIEREGHRGWVRKATIWGVDSDETIER